MQLIVDNQGSTEKVEKTTNRQARKYKIIGKAFEGKRSERKWRLKIRKIIKIQAQYLEKIR